MAPRTDKMLLATTAALVVSKAMTGHGLFIQTNGDIYLLFADGSAISLADSSNWDRLVGNGNKNVPGVTQGSPFMTHSC